MSVATHKPTRWGQNPTAAFDAGYSEDYTVTSSARGKRLTFGGTCPYCVGTVDYTVDLELVPSDSGGFVSQGASELQLVIECTCSEPHPGQPAGGRGCGQSWTIVVEA